MPEAPKMRLFGISQIEKIPQLKQLSKEQIFDLKVVSSVLPFRVNNYVLDELIDWAEIPKDPIYQLTFMQKEMLRPEHYLRMAKLFRSGASAGEIKNEANKIRLELNPHPAGQLSANVPQVDEEPVPGVQHKYRETCLIFPAGGQTCFSYCTFCFRWPQFVGMEGLKFATDEANQFLDYVRSRPEVSDVLVTGGDPMIMSAQKMRAYLSAMLHPDFDHVENIRIGTKFLAYWPYRVISDRDAHEILALFESLNKAGKRVSVMAHFNHPRELETAAVEVATQRLLDSGCMIRTQSPLLKHINDAPDLWAKMWRRQVRMGMVPYYMFVERDTGPRHYFEVPLARGLQIYREAIQRTSGLVRTVRGPSMSCLPGKVCVEGIAEVGGEKVFVLSMLQGRNSDWVKKPFFAKFDEKAAWLDDLKPAFKDREFFFEQELREALDLKTSSAS
jgi:KamA family protein